MEIKRHGPVVEISGTFEEISEHLFPNANQSQQREEVVRGMKTARAKDLVLWGRRAREMRHWRQVGRWR